MMEASAQGIRDVTDRAAKNMNHVENIIVITRFLSCTRSRSNLGAGYPE
jgi:hypothetical protein